MSKKVKVLHRVSSSGVGGMEKYVFEHCKKMDRDLFHFDLLSRNCELTKNKNVQDLGMKVRSFSIPEFQDRDLLKRQIGEILDDGYDVIHLNTCMWAGFLIEEMAMERGISKVIVHSHSSGVDSVDALKRKQFIERHEYYKARFGKEYATHFCACSLNAAEWLFGPQIPKEDIHILKNAIEVEDYLYNEKIRKEVRDELELGDAYVIGNIGRFAYVKNQSFLIDVFCDVHKYNPNSKLIIIGGGELEEQLSRKVSELGLDCSVLLLGWRDDIPKLYQAMDLFALPSFFEGLPIVGIEAQTSGLPTLMSNHITEEAIVTENAKLLPLDKDAWTKEIIYFMSRVKRNNMEKIITDAGYNIKYAAKELERIYLE
ncbi:Glycosyltransferase involved in cell wall bisynthesis [Butyrivibrio sp. ob235]|uniref:glycosyltransferase n=1 Tax=Butyrivibrio sp. ob235 TaxID=1761780 RepID=UPI0008C30426|nr:glycosyltransferase [Butyrivibrio sp. ob235]SEL97250.1 Glycosyltransferase involved in cell wall bisynthesis [Butyrivibrio sp. ob235]